MERGARSEVRGARWVDSGRREEDGGSEGGYCGWTEEDRDRKEGWRMEEGRRRRTAVKGGSEGVRSNDEDRQKENHRTT
jgi:hypothetical protein